MSDKIEGTLMLDGLVEGRLPSQPGAADKLRKWTEFARSAGLHMHLQIDGGTFNILADNQVMDAGQLGPDPVQVVSSALQEMLKIFPPGERGAVSSTLRSVEYRPGEETQTLYVIREDGKVEPQQRTARAITTPSRAPLGRRDRRRLWLTTAGAVGLVALVLVMIVNPGILGRHDQPVRIDPQTVTLDAGRMGQYIQIVGLAAQPPDGMVLTLRRTEHFPVDGAQLDERWRSAESLSQRMAVEALARGYIRAELFSPDGTFYGQADLRIASLREAEQVPFRLPAPRERLGRIVLTW